MNKKKNILIFSVAYFPFVGGAEVAVKELTDRLTDFEFDLITVNLDGKQKTQEKVDGVNVYRVGISKICKYTFPISGFIRAWMLHRKNKYDMTWAIMANYAGLAGLFFKYKFPKIPFVLTLQEGDSMEHIKKRMHPLWLFKSLFKKADKIQAISNYLADWARSMGAKREVVVVPNGVDTNRFKKQDSRFKNDKRKELGFTESDVVLVTTSRLVEKNAVGDIIEALQYLPEQVKLLVVGSGSLQKNLELRINNYELGDRVKLLGHVVPDKIREYLWSSDIFIRPSLSEGFGNAFIEAMAAGLPVIATPVGGIVDFLKDGETGLFCEVKNPKSIAQKVEKLVKDKESKGYIVTNALKMVSEKYDWDIVARQMKGEVFDKLTK